MAALSTPVDYITTYFKFTSLTRSVGKPTYETIKSIKEELKANAASVHSDKGGGNHGYLGLILSPTAYASIPGTIPFIPPVHPGVLTIPANSTEQRRAIIQHTYQENIREYREYIDVKNALKKQLSQSMDKKYLQKHTNKQTSTITDTIPVVLLSLYKRFAPITSRTLRETENIVRDQVYSLQDSLEDVWTSIEDLIELAEAAGLEYSEEQKLAMALEVLTNVPDFEKACIEWHNTLPATQNWSTFTLHFEAAHDSLAQVRGTTMAQAGYQPMANMMASQYEQIEALKRKIEDMEVQQQQLQHSPPVDHAANNAAAAAAAAATAAATGQDTVQAVMLSTLATIAQQLASANSSSNNRNNSNGGAPRNNERRQRRDTSKYCYTHGACAHTGSECRAKTTGHQDTATFSNKMGGSTSHCRTTNA